MSKFRANGCIHLMYQLSNMLLPLYIKKMNEFMELYQEDLTLIWVSLFFAWTKRRDLNF